MSQSKEVINFIDFRITQLELSMDYISDPQYFELTKMECLKARSEELKSLKLEIQLMEI